LKNVEFVSNRNVMTANGRAVLDEIATILAASPERRFEVAGFTDNLGAAAINQALSQSRADAVVSYLVSKGLVRERFTARGYGAERPVADNGTAEGRQKNRRIEFTESGG
jgi:OOP family OmpA-OmpF porin